MAPPNPCMDETNRNGKSLEDQRKWWVLLNIMSSMSVFAQYMVINFKTANYIGIDSWFSSLLRKKKVKVNFIR